MIIDLGPRPFRAFPDAARPQADKDGLFQAANGASITAMVATGTAAELGIRIHRGGQPLPGVGDEAYASGAGVVARRGQVVVSLAQRSPGPVNQAHLVWLLGLAVARAAPVTA